MTCGTLASPPARPRPGRRPYVFASWPATERRPPRRRDHDVARAGATECLAEQAEIAVWPSTPGKASRGGKGRGTVLRRAVADDVYLPAEHAWGRGHGAHIVAVGLLPGDAAAAGRVRSHRGR